jgi:hypothetical protein
VKSFTVVEDSMKLAKSSQMVTYSQNLHSRGGASSFQCAVGKPSSYCKRLTAAQHPKIFLPFVSGFQSRSDRELKRAGIGRALQYSKHAQDTKNSA